MNIKNNSPDAASDSKILWTLDCWPYAKKGHSLFASPTSAG